MESIYRDFAYIYDKLMYDVDYKEWADYIEKIFEINGLKPSLIADLGCGTGNFCIEMDKKGYEMIGIDSSPDMLDCAKKKSYGRDILFLNQDMANFELYGTVDAIVCLMDSINYLTYIKDVKKLMKLVKNYLNPGGLFIFDINSPYKFKKILKDNVFYDISDEITYVWQNHFDSKRKICEFDITFFVKEGQHYNKYDEVHYERCYEVDELKKIITWSGLTLVSVYDSMTFNRPLPKSERIFCLQERGIEYVLF
ncbi:class I SAM-dependent DNA methyltransferase [Acetivibrio straminisolvens]|uniref:class I SAM-dependent DNA methyltransferase n=1 Tax=Acetivibrio straminisolvens TaxID=253314 RepID=UPI001FB084DC|nr:class I SAM-dependent methyltransferase [Acetivibrio straminisolvens]